MRLLECYKELRAIRIRASIGHWQQPFLRVRKEVWLVIKFMPVNTFPTCSILICNVASLHHKILNYPMKNISFIPQLFSFFSSTNCSKILDRLWNLIFEELKYHSTFDVFTSIFSLSYIYIEKYFRICFFVRR